MYIHTTIIIDESIIRKRFYGKEDLKRKETKVQVNIDIYTGITLGITVYSLSGAHGFR